MVVWVIIRNSDPNSIFLENREVSSNIQRESSATGQKGWNEGKICEGAGSAGDSDIAGTAEVCLCRLAAAVRRVEIRAGRQFGSGKLDKGASCII